MYSIIKVLRGPAEIWTRIAGFKVQSDNRYTTGPIDAVCVKKFLEFWQSKVYSIIKVIKEVPPRFELGLLDSKSRVITVTPRDRLIVVLINFSRPFWQSKVYSIIKVNKKVPPRFATRIAGFKVQSDNRYTTGPIDQCFWGNFSTFWKNLKVYSIKVKSKRSRRDLNDGLLDLKSRVITVTPRDRLILCW